MEASYAVGDFRGGEISTLAQGRFDKPDYRTSLKTCRNAFPIEAGPWVRRPGTRYAGTTLNGAPGRVIEFDVKQSVPFTCEYTDGNLRFRSGPNIVGGTLATPYTGGSWANLRTVQAENVQILLNATVAPQALTNTGGSAFTLSPAIFNDGPYLDPLTNGAQLTPGSKSGIVTLTLDFPAYSATVAYAKGTFVTYSSVNYVSLSDQNVNNQPDISGSFWAATSANAAINNGQGFLGSDVGRLIRLFSEPAPWASGGSYSSGAFVSYNPGGQPNAATYWKNLAGTNAAAPGTDATTWALVSVQGAALWTWGKIVSLSNAIAGATGSNIGNMTSGGGLAAAFDGAPTKVAASCSEQSTSGGALSVNTSLSIDGFVGKNYGGQQIFQATVFPSSDAGFGIGSYTLPFGGGPGSTYAYVPTFVLNLRGKATNPASPSDGTLLGTSGSIANITAPVTIASNDQVTSWNYVWVEIIATFVNTASACTSYSFSSAVAQVEFFNPPGTGTTAGVNVEILGPALLYTNVISTWRLGVYSNTTGWPTCGIYDDGRLWLGGAVDNRFDACYANGIVGGTINFAPTDQYGQVTAANAISYTLNSDSVNPTFWMAGDLQGVLIGTQAGEVLVQAPTAGSISPLNISAKFVTKHGSAFIPPVRAEHTLIIVQRFARKPLEMFPDVFSGKFSAPNLADKADHFTRAGIAELAYTSAVTPIVWGRCKDGSWFGITYKRDSLASSQPPTFYGWHGHTLGSGRVVESICAGASVGGDLDALTMVTNDPVTNIRHVEFLTDVQDELTPLAQSWYLDDAVRPTVALSTNHVVLSGLPWPDGTVVQVFAAGFDCGDNGKYPPGVGPYSDFTVAGGAVTVTFGDGILVNGSGPGRGLFTRAVATAAAAAGQIVVGFTYDSDGQIVRPMTQAETGARNGPAFAKLSRGHRYGMKLVNTAGLSVGGSFDKMLPVAMKKGKSVFNIDPGTTYTGIAFGELLDDYDYEGGTPAWRVSRPFPANIVIIGSNLSTMDQ